MSNYTEIVDGCVELVTNLHKGKSGIYIIYTKYNNKFYLGSTTQCFIKRRNSHLCELRQNKHHSKKLQNVYNKYGEGVFSFKVLEFCSKEECLEREQYYINLYNPDKIGYNINNNAQNCTGRKMSQETKLKISKKLRGKIFPHMFKRVGLPSLRSESILKIKDGVVVDIFPNQKEAAESVNGGQGNISNACKKGKMYKGFYFKKENEK